MLAILCAVVSIFAFRFRDRASLEIQLIALRHQVTVLRRQRPGRLRLSDRLLWMWLYRIWPICRMSRANPLVGRAPHPWGTAQARHQDQPSHGWALDTVASQDSLPDLADLPA